MSTLIIHNWDKWQSYRSDRGQPPWIKIHRECMRNIEWVGLSDAQRGQLVAIWLLAADRNGVIPASPSIIKKLCHLDTEPDLNMFIEQGFIDAPQAGVKLASSERQVDQPEKRREETETEADKKQTSATFVLPEFINADDWNLWIKTRKGKKLNDQQKQGYVDKLWKWMQAGIDYESALKDAALAGWQGLHEPKAKFVSRSDRDKEIADQLTGRSNATTFLD